MKNESQASDEEDCVSAAEHRALVQTGAMKKQGQWYRVLDWEKLSQRARGCIGEINVRNGFKVKFRR